MKDQCFHTTVPIKNDLKMLKLQAWPQKEDFPRRWLTEGSTVSAVCDTECTKTLVLEAFVDNLGLRKRWFQEGKSPMVCLGNSEMVAPSAGVEFWATKDTENSWYSERTQRRNISALVLRNLPTEVLMSGDDLINLGLLPPEWPNHREKRTTGPGKPPRTKFPPNKNMTEREGYTNALLTLSFGEGELLESESDEPMDTDEEIYNLYNSRMAIPDAIFDTDTDVTLIPGFKEGKLPNSIIKICTKYAAVFKKSLTADKRTKLEPVVLQLSPGAKPARRAIGCRKTPLH